MNKSHTHTYKSLCLILDSEGIKECNGFALMLQ